jgi:hypothetical protein
MARPFVGKANNPKSGARQDEACLGLQRPWAAFHGPASCRLAHARPSSGKAFNGQARGGIRLARLDPAAPASRLAWAGKRPASHAGLGPLAAARERGGKTLSLDPQRP